MALQATEPFDPVPWIAPFAERCEASQEYQGHGWGVSWWTGSGWGRHRSLQPIWEEMPPELPTSPLVVVHARSAFRNEGIVVENNMPFVDGGLAFAFNGELRGVRLSVPGDTGAARLLRLLQRFRAVDSDMGAALRRLDRVVAERSRYVRAMNIVVSDGHEVWVNSHHSEDHAYFTLHEAAVSGAPRGLRIVSSERFEGPVEPLAWTPLPNRTTISIDRERPCSS